MRTLKTDKAQVGMVVGADVVSPRGVTMAKAGVAITDKHLKAFKAWGVTEVVVAGDAAGQPAESQAPGIINEAMKADIVGSLDRLFQKTDRNDPVIAELYQLAVKRALTAPQDKTS